MLFSRLSQLALFSNAYWLLVFIFPVIFFIIIMTAVSVSDAIKWIAPTYVNSLVDNGILLGALALVAAYLYLVAKLSSLNQRVKFPSKSRRMRRLNILLAVVLSIGWVPLMVLLFMAVGLLFDPNDANNPLSSFLGS